MMRDKQLVYVRVIGRGTPVLMLHGVGMDSRHWLPFILPLINQFRFYLPDFRGSGRSARTPVNQPDVFVNLAEDVQDIIRHFRLEDFLLVGYSLGASTSLHLMQQGEFANVRRYLHIDQSPTISNPEDGPYGLMGLQQDAFFATLCQLHSILDEYRHIEYLHALPPAARKDATRLLAEVLAVAAGQPQIGWLLKGAALSPRFFSFLARGYQLHTLRSYLWGYFNTDHDYREFLRQSDLPMTFFVGRRSILYEYEGQKQMASLAKNSKIVSFEKGGHLLKVEQPIQFVKELVKFLKEG